jgi:plasmid stabilization system protein ParE
MKVVLLPFAKNDLQEIRRYISKESPQSAKMVAVGNKSNMVEVFQTL